jgi:hypothetical protein
MPLGARRESSSAAAVVLVKLFEMVSATLDENHCLARKTLLKLGSGSFPRGLPMRRRLGNDTAYIWRKSV